MRESILQIDPYQQTQTAGCIDPALLSPQRTTQFPKNSIWSLNDYFRRNLSLSDRNKELSQQNERLCQEHERLSRENRRLTEENRRLTEENERRKQDIEELIIYWFIFMLFFCCFVYVLWVSCIQYLFRVVSKPVSRNTIKKRKMAIIAVQNLNNLLRNYIQYIFLILLYLVNLSSIKVVYYWRIAQAGSLHMFEQFYTGHSIKIFMVLCIYWTTAFDCIRLVTGLHSYRILMNGVT